MKKVYIIMMIIALIILGFTVFGDISTKYISIIHGLFIILLVFIELYKKRKDK